MTFNIRPLISLRAVLALFAGLLAATTQSALALGEPGFVLTNAASGCFPLFDRTTAPLLIAADDWPGVRRAANDLAHDIERVTGTLPAISENADLKPRHAVIIGTLGHNTVIDRLVREQKLAVTEIAGQWESFVLQVVTNPLPGIESALVIAGSDKRGTIYGIYELSEQIGVSPWHFWCDVPAKHHDRLYLKPGRFVTGPPSVKYRGIFLNDEAPALSGWVAGRYGTVPGLHGVANFGRGFYTNIFELMLRLRANYLWPAMWGNAFNEDDPENPRLADEYGIVMGTSHQEPMLRAQKEWDRGYGRTYGAWDYNQTNQRPVLRQFWRAGIRRNQNYESIITMGLRAENDSGAPVGRALTEEIVGVQRHILADEVNPDLAQIPQVWCLYKEVMNYYADGLRVPDDVTLLWAEDNWGNVRRLPTAAERRRRGGAGIYYHLDYHGSPRSYQWINTSPIAKIWDQMSLAKEYGADRIWIVNVGHFNKSGEFPLEFFMRYAWDTKRWTSTNLDEFTRLWAEREFGALHAAEIADLLTQSARFNARRKPELLDAHTYSLLNYREFATVVAGYRSLADRAQTICDQLPPEYHDAFYGMVQYPIKAAAGLNTMYLAAAKNALYAQQGRASANDFAAETRALFAAQTNLADHFNHVFAGGKWNHFMDQAYIGYRSWDPPHANNLGAVRLREIPVPAAAAMGVAVEGESGTAGGTVHLDRFGQRSRSVEVFNKGRTPFAFTATAGAPWITLSQSHGTIDHDSRLDVSVDWAKAPSDNGHARIEFSGTETNFTVHVTTFNPATPPSASSRCFVEADGYVSIEAAHYARKTDAGANRWIEIEDYGHTLSGLRADGPPETLTTPGKDAPCLEYEMHLFHTGQVAVETIVGPTLNFLPGRPLRYAVAFDDEVPQTVTIVPAGFDAHNGNRNWEESVMNNCRRITSTHIIQQTGNHTLKIWMVDPAVVLQKVIVNTGGVKPSYLGPPESRHFSEAGIEAEAAPSGN
ncbi:MAG TPA: glycosyl hydrolase 115 family protein [Verrucomicrobiae bacterium]|nr:glycosyl hydrolase 115 family protein [Verrucomicrobiae bacterium]